MRKGGGELTASLTKVFTLSTIPWACTDEAASAKIARDVVEVFMIV